MKPSTRTLVALAAAARRPGGGSRGTSHGRLDAVRLSCAAACGASSQCVTQARTCLPVGALCCTLYSGKAGFQSVFSGATDAARRAWFGALAANITFTSVAGRQPTSTVSVSHLECALRSCRRSFGTQRRAYGDCEDAHAVSVRKVENVRHLRRMFGAA